ncbi:unnamed protein product [Cylicocyclus nassatus]|uniref:Uncharacterized protein n=1 Tax=Cylicocyclus nassatus TaxID=53992 RepID=A0AA36HFN9_CYLNA|nr:unnamed protein product [Cylicocyclus nassatus]
MYILLIFYSIHSITASSTTKLTSTQAQHTWDLFKLHNVHILFETAFPRPGFIFRTISDEGKHLVDLLLLPSNRISLTLPLKSGWTRRYTIPLPQDQDKLSLLVTLEKKHVSVVVNCLLSMTEAIEDVGFPGISPTMLVTNRHDTLRIDSGNPTRDICPELHSSLGNVEIENSEGLREDAGTRNVSTGSRRAYKSCLYNGRRRGHTEAFWPEQCVRCYCDDGTTTCQYQNPVTCPKLTCSAEHRITPENGCCPVCVGADFCAEAPCHRDAECVNQANGAQCKCKEGFYGDGYTCYDIDECSFDNSAREQLGGCSTGSICINEPGSFRCECLPNHQKIDSRNCVELLRV